MRCLLIFGCIVFTSLRLAAQDTTVVVDHQKFTLPPVVVKSGLDYASILRRIKNDTTFYKAFRTLRVVEYSAYNAIRIPAKDGTLKASYTSKTRQHRANGCRTTEV